ncbi:ABC transporter permease [Amycolatopsis rubida]|uniref:ABC transporter permease n=1 Tax=Amycolatopsis rubida TaxID=112413 RepID=A0A1I5J3A8_9PSEU|nr:MULTISPECIES: ABC transporter permease [Amycolatopsis]MYW93294.1 ABC transporter permease subunit [Amycolatopsis rubida]NEC58281.1 ABC transporter permease [Amycolatopsis rubida]OAP28723.1 Dipeptide transport system permease protein DppB [Amycolatopsis sp. M39]SFO67364.1 peptide/nickel transport system permease protein [Amycolatopsis rubida]
MLAFALRRLFVSVPILIVSTFVVFVMVSLSANPLTPLIARNPPPPPRTIELERIRLHLDQPILERYWHWITGVLHGDFGPSVQSTMNIGSEVFGRFGVTLRLIVLAMVVALILAVLIGVISASRQYSKFDYTATFFGFLFLSMPSFWFALVLKQIGISINTTVGDQVFYTIGSSSVVAAGGFWDQFGDVLGHLILPTISLALTSYAAWSRYQRASMLEVLNSDYVRLARAKGLPRWTVTRKHALRNALIPLTTVTALDIGSILGGAVVTETVFQWQGAGAFLLDAIKRSDVYAVEAWLLIAATFIILLNLVADLLYGLLDPRIRYA